MEVAQLFEAQGRAMRRRVVMMNMGRVAHQIRPDQTAQRVDCRVQARTQAKGRNHTTECKPGDAEVCYHAGRIYLRRRRSPEDAASGSSGKPQVAATKPCCIASSQNGLSLCAIKRRWLEQFQIAMRDLEVAGTLPVESCTDALVCDES